MKEIFTQTSSGNVYHIIHGWIKRNDLEFYSFSWMNDSVKGHTFILPKDTLVNKLEPTYISEMLKYYPSAVQSQEILNFIIDEFKNYKN